MPNIKHESWLVKPPIYDCVVAPEKGKCMLRHMAEPLLDCEFKNQELCKYRVKDKDNGN